MSSSSIERDKAIVIVAAIIEKDGKLLMVQEGREDVKGKWNLPAGHVDYGEDPITAVRREVKEETGYNVEPKSLAGIVAFKDKSGSSALRLHFNCEIVGGDFSEQEGESLDIKYMTKEELDLLKSQGKLRSEKTLWTVDDWVSRKEYPLDLMRKIEGIY